MWFLKYVGKKKKNKNSEKVIIILHGSVALSMLTRQR